MTEPAMCPEGVHCLDYDCRLLHVGERRPNDAPTNVKPMRRWCSDPDCLSFDCSTCIEINAMARVAERCVAIESAAGFVVRRYEIQDDASPMSAGLRERLEVLRTVLYGGEQRPQEAPTAKGDKGMRCTHCGNDICDPCWKARVDRRQGGDLSEESIARIEGMIRDAKSVEEIWTTPAEAMSLIREVRRRRAEVGDEYARAAAHRSDKAPTELIEAATFARDAYVGLHPDKQPGWWRFVDAALKAPLADKVTPIVVDGVHYTCAGEIRLLIDRAKKATNALGEIIVALTPQPGEYDPAKMMWEAEQIARSALSGGHPELPYPGKALDYPRNEEAIDRLRRALGLPEGKVTVDGIVNRAIERLVLTRDGDIQRVRRIVAKTSWNDSEKIGALVSLLESSEPPKDDRRAISNACANAVVELLKDMHAQGCIELTERSWSIDDIVKEARFVVEGQGDAPRSDSAKGGDK